MTGLRWKRRDDGLMCANFSHGQYQIVPDGDDFRGILVDANDKRCEGISRGDYETVRKACERHGLSRAAPDDHKPFGNGTAASSPVPPFHLIPTVALVAIAERFAKGVESYGDKAWNATSPNQGALLDREFVLDRLDHVINHAIKLRDKYATGGGFGDDDDAAAISWGGMLLVCAMKAREIDRHE